MSDVGDLREVPRPHCRTRERGRRFTSSGDRAWLGCRVYGKPPAPAASALGRPRPPCRHMSSSSFDGCLHPTSGLRSAHDARGSAVREPRHAHVPARLLRGLRACRVRALERRGSAMSQDRVRLQRLRRGCSPCTFDPRIPRLAAERQPKDRGSSRAGGIRTRDLLTPSQTR